MVCHRKQHDARATCHCQQPAARYTGHCRQAGCPIHGPLPASMLPDTRATGISSTHGPPVAAVPARSKGHRQQPDSRATARSPAARYTGFRTSGSSSIHGPLSAARYTGHCTQAGSRINGPPMAPSEGPRARAPNTRATARQPVAGYTGPRLQPEKRVTALGFERAFHPRPSGSPFTHPWGSRGSVRGPCSSR